MSANDRPVSDRIEPDPRSLQQAAESVHESIQNGQAGRAEEICRKAMTAVPGNPMFMYFLGEALAMQGRFGEGIPLVREVVKAIPGDVNLLENLGGMLFNAKNYDEAVETFKRVLRIRPDSPRTLCYLGKALLELGKKDQAEGVFRRVLEIVPNMPEALLAIGEIAYLKKEYDKALAFLERAENLWPDNADVHAIKAAALSGQDRHNEAIAAWHRVIAIRPNVASDYAHLGIAQLNRAKQSRSCDQPCADDVYFAALEEAVGAFHRCLALDPISADSHRGLGAVAWLRGDNREMIAHIDRALAIEPDHAESHFSKGVAMLRMGDYAQGWPEYEWRWKRPEPEYQRPRCTRPLWDGSDLRGKKILLYSEQGHGDVIQFVRFAPLVADLGAHIIVECDSRLNRLFHSILGPKEVVSDEIVNMQFDVCYPLTSLPLMLKTTLENIPNQIPYLHAEAADVEVWRQRLGEKKSFRVGIVWFGSSHHYYDRLRSCSLRLLAPLLAVPGTSFFSLQVGPRSETSEQLVDIGVTDLSPHLADFAQTAAALTQMDLLISVDTSIVHLAGAMGRSVWTLLAFEGCWRWLENRQDSPWYPTVRLFRQDKPGNWQGLIQEVARALRAEVEKDG